MHQSTREGIMLRYSQIEHVKDRKEIKHPILREALELMDIRDPNIEITSMADIPAGTGLGSSGSFTTCLLKALHQYKNQFIQPRELAEMACHIELDRLKEPIGKQDQYIASFGGLTAFEFKTNGEVVARPLRMSEDSTLALEDSLLLFSTGIYRSASKVLQEQDDKSKKDDGAMTENLNFIKDIGYKSCEALESGNLVKFGQLMNEHWEYKKKRSGSISNKEIDSWYRAALDNGAVGGKLIGAGGGGFLMFMTTEKERLRAAMKKAGLAEVRFRFDFEGTKVVV